MGGMQISTAKDIAYGLGCNFVQRMTQEAIKTKKLFNYERLNQKLREAGMFDIRELLENAGSRMWKQAARQRIAIEAVEELIENCEKGESGMATTKAGNWLTKNQGWAIAHLLICSILISALFKRAIEQLLAHLLI